MWNLKCDTNELIYVTEAKSQTQRTDCSYQERGEARDRWTGSLGLPDANYYIFIEWINNKVLLYNIRNYIQYPVINHNGKEYEKDYMSITELLLYNRN